MGVLAIEYVPIDTLRPYEGNPRKISDMGLEKLQRSIAEFGFVNPILAQRGSNMIIAGHQRWKAAKAAGLSRVPVIFLDLDDAASRAYNLADNRLQEESEWDFSKLEDVLRGLEQDGLDLSLTGFDREELDRLWAQEAQEGEGDEATEEDEFAPEPPEEPVTRPGDLWILGRHRLLCGDATNALDVARLLGDARPALMVTDPPYGVQYEPEWRLHALGDNAARRTGRVANDDRADWYDAWALFPGDVVYCWHGGLHADVVKHSLERAGFEVRAQIIWSKPRFVISRGHYHWQHEPCWYAVRRGAEARWIGDRSQTTLWEIPILDDDDQEVHSTQKPTECMARPIRNHSGDVYDPFVGSGTTIVAAERLGRRCFAMEIEPRYCDVAVTRWERLTGRKAERVSAQETGDGT